MRFGDFEVRIPRGDERASGYVDMTHGQVYALELRNHADKRCDADVVIDGKLVGRFRLEARDTLNLERPADEAKCFTFYQSGSAEARAAEISRVAAEDRGLISVTFRPERDPVVRSATRFGKHNRSLTENALRWKSRGVGGQSLGSDWDQPTNGSITFAASSFNSAVDGITGLSGSSDQRFTTVNDLKYDESGSCTIHLRLRPVAAAVSPLYPARRSTPVPPPLSKY